MSIGSANLYSYDYDQYGRLNNVTSDSKAFNYGYLADSDMTATMSRPNNITTTYTYEAARDLLTNVANGSVSEFGYVNDSLGRRTVMSRGGDAFATPDSISYTYNGYSEVTGAVSDDIAAYNYGFAYDNIGNRLTAALAETEWNYTVNNLNEYTALSSDATAKSPTYDDAGNMLANDGWSYTWSGENQLINAVKGNVRMVMYYDYMGRMIYKRKFVDDVQVTHTRYVYDGYKLLQVLNATNNNNVQQQVCLAAGRTRRRRAAVGDYRRADLLLY